LCGIGVAAGAGWMLAGGGLPWAEVIFGQPDPAALTSSGGAPVHVDSNPSGARVRIDGTTYGKTPVDLRLSSGQHTLSLQHPDALDDERIIQVPETGVNVDIGLWRRRP